MSPSPPPDAPPTPDWGVGHHEHTAAEVVVDRAAPAAGEHVVTSAPATPRRCRCPTRPPPFAWHDRDVLVGVLAPHGFAVSLDEHAIGFTGDSPRAHLEAEQANHPLAVAGRSVLESRGKLQPLLARMLETLEAANEDPDGFRVTRRYVVATARR